MTWIRKFDWIQRREYGEVLDFWLKRSPAGIETGRNILSEHIAEFSDRLPENGTAYIGPIEGRPLLSELYCGVAKAFNLNFHSQAVALNSAYTNGSLHSFTSMMQMLFAIIALFGVFIVRVGGRYYVIDVFPSFGMIHEDRKLRKQFGDDWWRYARVISDPKRLIEQGELFALFQRCLRVVAAPPWKETIVANLIGVDGKWFNRARNGIVYSFTGWTSSGDLMSKSLGDCGATVRIAAESIFDAEAQVDFGCLPQSLLFALLLKQVLAPVCRCDVY